MDPMQGGAAGAQQSQDPASQLQVDIPEELKPGSYANAVSVTVNVNEVVLDFGYLLPNTQKPIIRVVSRVNTNLRTAKSFLSVLEGAIRDFEAKQAAQQQSQAAPGMTPPPAAPMADMGPAPMPPMGPAPMGPAPMGPTPPPIPSESPIVPPQYS